MSLKRTGFTRRLYVPPPVAPLVPPQSWNQARTDSLVAVPKMQLLRSESYRRFVASFPCFWCDVAGFSQCAHDNYDKGMAMKVCDTRSFPLCGPRFGLVGCHQQFDLCIGITRDERRALGAEWVKRMQRLAREAGRPEVMEAA